MGVKGYIHSIESFGALDGPGIRYVLFMQGCPLRCLFCHNPDTWKMEDGKEVTTDEIIQDIQKYKNFIQSGGVTISGGEPMMQPEFCLDLIQKCKAKGFHTAIDTSGAISVDLTHKCIAAADLILLDIKDLDYRSALTLTGRDNANELNTLDYCEEIGKTVWIRHVLVPGYTLREDKLKALADFIKSYACVEKVELLPFHKMGEYKWEQSGYDYKLYHVKPPSEEEISMAKNIFSEAGIRT